MSERGGAESDPTRVFERIERYEGWDEDYYNPLALQLYDRAVSDMLDLPDAEFRSVFCWGVVVHIPDIGQALDELARILAPGDRLSARLAATNLLVFEKPIQDQL